MDETVKVSMLCVIQNKINIRILLNVSSEFDDIVVVEASMNGDFNFKVMNVRGCGFSRRYINLS